MLGQLGNEAETGWAPAASNFAGEHSELAERAASELGVAATLPAFSARDGDAIHCGGSRDGVTLSSEWGHHRGIAAECQATGVNAIYDHVELPLVGRVGQGDVGVAEELLVGDAASSLASDACPGALHGVGSSGHEAGAHAGCQVVAKGVKPPSAPPAGDLAAGAVGEWEW